MKILKKFASFSAESLVLIFLLIALIGVLAGGWGAAMGLRKTVADNGSVIDLDPSAVIEVERLRSQVESQIADARTFFLMGSRSIFDKLKNDKETFSTKLTEFEKRYGLTQIPEILKRIEALRKQEQEIFDQGMKYREEQTESKIVGQFYGSKTSPLLKQFSENFAEIAKLHHAELDAARNRARQASLDAQAQIPEGMTWFTSSIALLFLGMTVLVLRMLRRRGIHLRERERLVEAAKKSLLDRDEVLSAVSQDFKEPMEDLKEIAGFLRKSKSLAEVAEQADMVESTIVKIQGIVDAIYDQKKVDMGDLTLRLDQLPVADILEDAQLMLQPLAKKNDITVQFESVNQSVLAFADRERILRVILNLAGNAIKYTRKHSKVSIKVRSDQQFATISIGDSGPGIPEERLAGLFESFWQARETSNQGPGVGLAIVKTIIEAHGGTVKAESNLSGGTTFTFTLPRRRPIGAPLRKPSVTTARRAAPRPLNPEGPQL